MMSAYILPIYFMINMISMENTLQGEIGPLWMRIYVVHEDVRCHSGTHQPSISTVSTTTLAVPSS